MNTKHIENRATLDLQKKEVIQSLLDCWLANPQLRLGQLISSSLCVPSGGYIDLYNIEDYALVNLLSKMVAPKMEPIYPQITIKVERAREEGVK